MFNLTYNGKSFNQREEDGFVNVGQLCATHNKAFADWKRLNSTIDYLLALESDMGIPISELVTVSANAIGGHGTTWAHPLVAIEVARWISPAFGVWCNKHIKTLIETAQIETKEFLLAGFKDAPIEAKALVEAKCETLKEKVSGFDSLCELGLGEVPLTLTCDLIQIENGTLVTTSLKIAEVFDKLHKNVIQEIGSILSRSNNLEIELFYRKHFKESTYLDSYGRQQPQFLISREGFSFLALGFTGEKAQLFKIRYIEAFEQMHAQLRGYAIAHFLGRTESKKCLYVITNTITGLIKIGITNDVTRRRSQLECATGCELEVTYVTPVADNAVELEKKLHEHFAKFRRRGEWFEVEAAKVVEQLLSFTYYLRD
jgi:Rha family phage regulatory protein